MLDSGEPRGTTSSVTPYLFRAAVLIAFVLLAVQLWRLQIVEGPQLRQRADSNRVRISPIPPPRGVIYDRKGTIVASNAPIFVVSVTPADIKKDQESATYARLSGLAQRLSTSTSIATGPRRSPIDSSRSGPARTLRWRSA